MGPVAARAGMAAACVAAAFLSACSDDAVGPADAGVSDAGSDGASLDCDDHNSCTLDRVAGGACVHDRLPGCCGNGVVEATEVCDDANQDDFDGCSHECRFEQALVVSQIMVDGVGVGCDLTGDGTIDNAYGSAMNEAGRNAMSGYLTNDLVRAPRTTLLVLTGDDPLMQTGRFQLAMLGGVAARMPPVPSLYFTGDEAFRVTADGLDLTGQPLHALAGSAPGGMLATDTGRMILVLATTMVPSGSVVFLYERASLRGTLTNDGQRPTGLVARFCGGHTAATMYHFPNLTGLGGPTMLDVVVLGFDAFGYIFQATQPDIDGDGDGLEQFLDTDGDQAVDLCIDGNGTQIQGMACPEDPRIADAYSESIELTLVGARLVGRAR